MMLSKQIEGTRGVKIKAASLKFVTGEMEPVLVWGSVEDCMVCVRPVSEQGLTGNAAG